MERGASFKKPPSPNLSPKNFFKEDTSEVSTAQHRAYLRRVRFKEARLWGMGETNSSCPSVKVLVELFQKLAQSRARSPWRPPQRAKFLFGISLLLAFLFVPFASKRKVAKEFCRSKIVHALKKRVCGGGAGFLGEKRFTNGKFCDRIRSSNKMVYSSFFVF